MFLSSGEGKETPTLLGSIERAILIHWTEFYIPSSEPIRFHLLPCSHKPIIGPEP
jgi:hypothetical protein